MDLSRDELASLPLKELKELVDKEGGQRAFARKMGVPRTTLQDMLERARLAMFKHRPAPTARVEAVENGVRRFILTSAQDGTKLHEGFLTNLEAFQAYLSSEGPCDIMIAGFTYNKSLFEDHRKTQVFWADRLQPYMCNERVRLGDKVDWCAEMNTLPTADTPLSGFETYTRQRWGIFPHAKVQLKSIPTMKHEPAKIIMTTGAVTLPNYIQKRAGLKASFHHIIGAVLVEVNADGQFFCRHLIADEDGSFYDLDRFVQDGQVTTGHRVEAINWGDVHTAQIDPIVATACFGFGPVSPGVWQGVKPEGTMLGDLKPRYQFLHDVADFQSRNHHNVNDPHLMYALHIQGVESVEEEMREVAALITEVSRRVPEDSETVVVESNHNLALTKWLKSADYRYDPRNAKFFLQCQLACYQAIERGDHDFSIFEEVLTKAFDAWKCEGVRFLKLDESFKVLGIEKGMHGHLGANGARGTPASFTKAGSKATTGHTHSCEIRDGIYTAGTTSKLDLGYNSGLSSWSHSHVVTYPNGKRAIITLQQGAWRL